jgi:hypothetical protein
MITDYHALYFAQELSKRCPSDSIEKFAGTLIDAQVDLNPHQVEAALFAFKSPLSVTYRNKQSSMFCPGSCET